MSDSFSVLYNNCYGGFNLSDAFVSEYDNRSNNKISAFRYKSGIESIRCDPIAIAIFEEKGSEWCSGPDSMIEVRHIPRVFEHYWEIDEYDGDEHVRILVSDAFADILHTFMTTGDRTGLILQYAAIRSAELKLGEQFLSNNAPATHPGCA